MVEIGECIPCQHGDHDSHIEVTQAVPEGMIGGAICGCKGECVERQAKRDAELAAMSPNDRMAAVLSGRFR